MKLRIGRESAALITLSVLYAYLVIAAPAFFSIANLRDLALSNVTVLLVAIGMTFVIVAREIDVSVGSIFAICTVIAGLSALLLPMPLVPLVVIAAGVILGSINGAIVAWVKAPSIVVTLATMIGWREALRSSTGGAWIQHLPQNFQWFGLDQRKGEILIVATTLVVFGVLAWGAKHLFAFRAIYATGSDKEAARLAGIPTNWVTFAVFAFVGALTGFAALLNATRFSDVPANGGINLELKAIAAVVIGGTAITGGRGTLAGTCIGVVLLGSIAPALIFLGINPYWEKAIQGLIILAGVLFDVLRTWHQRRAVVVA